MGDLNEGPSNVNSTVDNLAVLYTDISPLVDCYSLPQFDVGPRPGTYNSYGIRNRLDYVFVSELLTNNVFSGGIFLKGLGGTRKTRPDAWETYEEMNRSEEQASDHAAVYIDLDLQCTGSTGTTNSASQERIDARLVLFAKVNNTTLTTEIPSYFWIFLDV